MNAPGRRRGALIGFALGESMGWPSLWQHAASMPGWTRRQARSLVEFGDLQHVTDTVVPFGLNVTPTALRWGPADATDWLAMSVALRQRGFTTTEVWQWLADRPGLRGRISAMTSLDRWSSVTDRRLLGRHNPHAHDDAAACRAIAVVVAGGRREDVAEDAAITACEDGLDAALLVGDQMTARLSGCESSSFALPGPPQSRLSAQLREMSASEEGDPFALAARLDDLCDRVYSYGSLASDSVPAALALVEHAERHGWPTSTLLAAAAGMHRQAATLPALCGALLGASRGLDGIASSLVERVRRPRGCSIAEAADLDLIELADEGEQ